MMGWLVGNVFRVCDSITLIASGCSLPSSCSWAMCITWQPIWFFNRKLFSSLHHPLRRWIFISGQSWQWVLVIHLLAPDWLQRRKSSFHLRHSVFVCSSSPYHWLPFLLDVAAKHISLLCITLFDFIFLNMCCYGCGSVLFTRERLILVMM